MTELSINLSTIKDVFAIIESLAILVASIFASLGFYQWRHEIIERRKIELAEEAAHLFSKFPNVIAAIRNPLITDKEGLSIVESGKTPNDGHVSIERILKNNDFFTQVDAIRYRFLAYFGQDKDELFEEGRAILHEIKWAAIPLANEQQGDYTEEERKRYCSIILGDLFGDELQKRAEALKDRTLQICASYFK